MPGNAFIRFALKGDAIASTGESYQSTHPSEKGWFEITDWSWDIEADTSFLKGTGAAVGKPTPGTLSFTHSFDKSSPILMTQIVRGTNFETMTIDMLKQTGAADGKPQVYFRLRAGMVFVSKVSSKSGEDGAITQDVEVVFKEVQLGYKPQSNANGSLGTTRPFAWSIQNMNLQTTGLVDLKDLKPL